MNRETSIDLVCDFDSKLSDLYGLTDQATWLQITCFGLFYEAVIEMLMKQIIKEVNTLMKKIIKEVNYWGRCCGTAD